MGSLSRGRAPYLFGVALLALFLMLQGWPATAQSAPGAGRYTAVSAGYAHTCALTPASAVDCWGFNYPVPMTFELHVVCAQWRGVAMCRAWFLRVRTVHLARRRNGERSEHASHDRDLP